MMIQREVIRLFNFKKNLVLDCCNLYGQEKITTNRIKKLSVYEDFLQRLFSC